MEHTYQSPMMLPAAYAVLSEDEMIYIDGGEFSFAVGDHTVTVRPEVLAQQVAYYTTNIIINGMYLLGQGYVQQVTRTLITGLADGLTLGGTSIMIVVGVALETTQQIESQMMMRHYKGFLE